MKRTDDYPDYTGYLEYLDEHGFDETTVNRIVNRHLLNRKYTKDLYERYKCYEDKVPIFLREARFKDPTLEAEHIPPLNNRLNNDFFGEINDITIGYFAGKQASYSYSRDRDAEESTEGAEEGVKAAQTALTDFITRNNFYNLNQEIAKFASVCGYAGRLFYINPEGEERVMVIPPYECVVLARNEVQEPDYAIRYYSIITADDAEEWRAEAYDSTYVYFYRGHLGSFQLVGQRPHMFDYCPLQLMELKEQQKVGGHLGGK